ncbi:MAG: hypothetical protein ACRD0N_14180 [Acidimicrobiales bacterium]
MSRASRVGRLVAGAVAVAVLGYGCSDDGGGSDEAATTSTTAAYDASAKVASPAVDLRAAMTTLMSEHVLLVGFASSHLVAGADPAPAVAALEENTLALAEEFRELYGDETRQVFVDLWRRNVAALLEFAAGSAVADQARIDKGKADMKAAQDELATALNEVNIQLTTDALTEQLEGYSTTVQQAVTSLAKKDAMAVEKLKQAADETASLAIVVVAAVVRDKGQELPGDVDALSAALRTELATKLQDYTYLTGLAATAATTGADPGSVSGPQADTTLELARTFGTIYGDEPQRDFLELWRAHLGYLDDFIQGAMGGDRIRMDNARQDLDGFRRQLGELLNSVNPNLSAEDLTTDLGEHQESLLAAIEAHAATDPAQVVKLRAAAGHVPGTALFLATGIARQFPTKFG